MREPWAAVEDGEEVVEVLDWTEWREGVKEVEWARPGVEVLGVVVLVGWAEVEGELRDGFVDEMEDSRAGELVREPLGEPDLDLCRLRELMLGTWAGLVGAAIETILTPRLVEVLAGMKRVVWSLGAAMAIRFGLLPLHPAVVSWVPVE